MQKRRFDAAVGMHAQIAAGFAFPILQHIAREGATVDFMRVHRWAMGVAVAVGALFFWLDYRSRDGAGYLIQLVAFMAPAILLLLVVVFLLICGMFMETTVIALILTPILLPVMRIIGVNEVVLGMIMMTTVTFGVMTPPVGTALYAVSDIMECPIEETFKKGWPFYLAIVCVILFMIFFPQAVLFLPNLVYGA